MMQLNEPAAIGKTFNGIAYKYNLHLEWLYMDQDAIRIAYKIFPPVAPIEDSDSELKGTPSIAWHGYAEDDLGNSYQSAGGAFGLSSDCTHTDGVLSFVPLLDESVSQLRVTMISERISPEFKCEFVISF
jgi:hypothetical protein